MAVTMDARITGEKLTDAIETKLLDLPPLPSVVVRVVEAMNSPSTSATDLTRMIASDPALSAKILRLVNSSYYGYSSKISTVTRAIVVLGFNTIGNLATAVGIGSAFRPSNKCKLDREKFWEHSVISATTAWAIARKRRMDSRTVEEAFVGGLMHDIGKLFLDQYFPEEYAAAIAYAEENGVTILEAEKIVLHISHCAVGRRIAENWKLPVSLVAMIAEHHRPVPGSAHFDLVAIVNAANSCSNQLEDGESLDRMREAMHPDAQTWLGFDAEAWITVEQEAIARYQEIKDFMLRSLGVDRTASG